MPEGRKKEGVALLTWGCRYTPSPAANTRGCDSGVELRRPCKSTFGWCHICKSPQERSKISHQSGVGLEIRKTTLELSIGVTVWKVNAFGNKSLHFFKADDFAPILFFKEYLDLDTGDMTSSDSTTTTPATTNNNNTSFLCWFYITG